MNPTFYMESLTNAVSRLTRATIDIMFEEKRMNVGNVGFLLHRHKGAYGYCFTGENWNINEQGVREIGISPHTLTLGIDEILTTVAHELVHAANNVAGVKDCSGKYHNRKFADGCSAVGLEAVMVGNSIGYITPRQHPPIYDQVLEAVTHQDLEVINSAKVALGDIVSRKDSGRNLAVHQCPRCKLKARAKPTAYLMCMNCELELVVQ